ncbi:MAG: DNA replication/repair protein RecF [Firmicutes bacterium]|nr:DNA replication/repair protein RecF [Bacillota bacterium]
MQLENFRNFTALQVDLLPGTNIIHGDNANGKTNFIEALCFCATGKSIRANHDKELINFNAEESHLQAVVCLDDYWDLGGNYQNIAGFSENLGYVDKIGENVDNLAEFGGIGNVENGQNREISQNAEKSQNMGKTAENAKNPKNFAENLETAEKSQNMGKFAENAENPKNFMENAKIAEKSQNTGKFAENAENPQNFVENVEILGNNMKNRETSQTVQKRRIDVHLFRDGKKKGFAIDHIPLKKLSELFGSMLVVVFTPENLQIVKGGPAERRAFVDLEICQLNGVYYHALRQYYQALRQRNNLLKSIAKDRKLRETLEIWDVPLCENGAVIMAHRAAFIDELGALATELHAAITGGKERLNMTYKPQIIGGIDEYHDRLKRNTERDIILGSTSAGIQKDDILFKIDGTDARTYASQGQQRTAALAVKLAEIALIKQRTRRKPILLLDDVISELDEHRQNFLFRNIGELQTVITCTGVEDVLRKVSGNIIRVENGRFYGKKRG